MQILRVLIVSLCSCVPSFASAVCALGGEPSNNIATHCCSGTIESNGTCAAVSNCLPGGAPANLAIPGACCSRTVNVGSSGVNTCAYVSSCYADDHPANLAIPGACCSGSVRVTGDGSKCASASTKPFTVGLAFVDLNHDQQQDDAEPGAGLGDGQAVIYAVANGHIVDSGPVASDGFWRIGRQLQTNVDYTFIISHLFGLANGIETPPSVFPFGVSSTGENVSLHYGATGFADNMPDGQIVATAEAGTDTAPTLYVNFGFSDRIFASAFE